MAERWFSEQDVRDLVCDNEIDRGYGENRRWSREVTSVVQVDGKCYMIDWEEGLTEMQEDTFREGSYPEVEKVTYDETIQVTEWKVLSNK